MMRGMLTLALGVALGAGGLGLAVHGHEDETPGVKVEVLSSHDVDEKIDGQPAHVTVQEVTWPPGTVSPPHRHPGPVFGYVIEGELETRLDDGPIRRLKAGETFYEPGMILHALARNPNAKGRTRVLAVILHARESKQVVLPPGPAHSK